MKDKRCFTCKYQGKISLDTTNCHLYDPRGKSLTISLCYTHSVEFFKLGQKNYMLKYGKDVTEFFGYEEDSLTLNVFSYYR